MTGSADQAKFLTGNLTKHIISMSLTVAVAFAENFAWATLRSRGVAKLAMMVAGAVNAIFDPVFNFALDMGYSPKAVTQCD